ncbi:MAG: O-antigen ligase family protein [Bacteroidetes bacterium]|nr:O-antigen ligase family protein [Bacteroidota bacterium]
MAIAWLKSDPEVWLMALFVVFLPFFPLISPFFLVAGLVFTVGRRVYSRNYSVSVAWKYLVPPAGIFFIFLIGLSHSENIENGLFEVQKKLSFLIVPAFFFLWRKPSVSEMVFLLRAFILALIASAFFCLVQSLLAAWEFHQGKIAGTILTVDPASDILFGSSFSYFIHPGYLAMYMNLAFTLLALPFILSRRIKIFSDGLAIPLLCFIFVVNILTASKINIIVLFLLLFGFLVSFAIVKRKVVLTIILAILVTTSSYLAFNYSRVLQYKMIGVQTAINGNTEDMNANESTQLRIFVWKSATKVICESPVWGVGTGDVMNELSKKYSEGNGIAALDSHLNAHNEYLQEWIANGIPGLFILLVALVLPVVWAVRQRKTEIWIFIFVVAANFLVETVLAKQSGILFFVFFYCFLLQSSMNAGSKTIAEIGAVNP